MNSLRLDLQSTLEEILGSNKVYYQPPARVDYPCIIYDKSDYALEFANDKRYKTATEYIITVIGKEADNEEICYKLMDLPYCNFDRRFISDNLYHDVFTLFL